MNHVRLASLSLEGFRSFRTKQVFRLPERGMVMVRGRSGHGKSNFALGIAHALGYSPLPATDLVAWDWDAKWGARACLTYGNTDLQVERGSKFDLVIDGEKITGSAASKNERLVKAIGLEPDLLGALTYRPQRKFGLFLSMQDDEKKEFLTKLLDLGKFEREAEAAEKVAPGLDGEVSLAEMAVHQLQDARDSLALQTFSVEDEAGPREVLSKTQAIYLLTAEAYRLADVKVLEYQRSCKTESDSAYKAALAGVKDVEEQAAAERAARAPLPEAQVTAEEVRLQELLDKANALLKKLQAEDRVKQHSIDAQRTSIQQKIWSERQVVSTAKKLEAQLADARHRLEHLTQNTTCPTCTQQWLGGAEKNRSISAVRAEIAQHEESIKLLDRSRNEIEIQESLLLETTFTPNPKIDQMLAAKSQAEQRLATERAKSASARVEMESQYLAKDASWRALIATAKANAERERADIQRRQQTAVQEMQEAIRPLREEMDRAKAAQDSASMQDSLVRQKNRWQRENAAKRDAELVALDEKLAGAQKALEEAEHAAGRTRDFAALTRSYLDRIFDEVLVEISEETNSVLARVPNVQHITFGFRSEVEAKTTGKKKAKITPIVHIDGTQRPFDGLSGGQKSVVELATDIAIRRVVTNRRQVHIGWLLLDEAFDGLGKIEKEACMEVLQAAAQEDLILVVDHATEFKDMFNQFIDIEMVQGESRVE